jgi:spoIIIJ-associated protein
MNIKANISAGFIDKPSESNDGESISILKRVLLINITGQDLSILIGRQAETLQALQFITSLIVNKKAGRAVPLSVDVEGYRERRKHQLVQMAQRMAEQAIRTGRRQVLEPMSSEDRRMIHLELRDHPKVFTESIGEEPRRKVTIVPK